MSDALAVVRRLAERAANQRGHSLHTAGLRLFDVVGDAPSGADGGAVAPELDEPVSPFDLGRAYELALRPATRRAAGAHLTPAAIARGLVAMTPEPAGPQRVLDPAVGGAAFLIVAADRLVAAGAHPSAVVDGLHGVDIDPGAVATAEAALAIWALDHDIEPGPVPNLVCGDGLLMDLPPADLVIGNPPFLNQLRAASTNTAERRDRLKDRYRELMGAYTDDAWLFLAAGMRALMAGGTLAMIQPLSILAARHAEPIRRRLHATAPLRGCWVAGEPVFDAAVQVCGLVLGRGSEASSGSVERRFGPDFELRDPIDDPPRPHRWGSAAAALVGVPEIDLLAEPVAADDRTVADLASATAGFRDQFYGFVPHVREAVAEREAAAEAPLVTAGMIEPLALDLGRREFRFAKRRFRAPAIDLAALAEGDAVLHEWVRLRRRPKVLLATQTRVVEVWVDAAGTSVPATPVVSIEPHDGNDATCWLLAASLSAPAVTAHVLGSNFGTALSINALKLSARDVLATPLPALDEPWHEAAELAQSTAPSERTSGFWREFGSLMNRAYAIDDPKLLDWWLERVAAG